jgi:hypothetical protein
VDETRIKTRAKTTTRLVTAASEPNVTNLVPTSDSGEMLLSFVQSRQGDTIVLKGKDEPRKLMEKTKKEKCC